MSEVKRYEAPDMPYMHTYILEYCMRLTINPANCSVALKNQGIPHTEPCLLLKINNLKYKGCT